jgi:pimeloyl-ACP methyl ester carboxylesterase
MKPTRRARWWNYLLAMLGAAIVALAVAYFVFPASLMKVMVAAERRSAGLQRHAVDVGGDRIVYLDGGSGTPVVLLHGFGANKDIWNKVAARLVPHYRVIAPDLPGFGESPVRAGARYDAWSQAQRLHAVLAALDVHAYHVGGNSMGALISVVHTSLYPQEVRSLMIGAAPGVRAPKESETFKLVAAGTNPFVIRDNAEFDRLVRLAFYRPPPIPAPFKRVMLEDWMARSDSYTRIFADLNLRPAGPGPLEPLLPGLAVPTLILWGAHDRMLDVSAAGTFSAAINGSETTIFPDCGHTLPRDCPETTATRYLEFLDAIPEAGPPH